MPPLLYATSTISDGNLSLRLEPEEIVGPRRVAVLAQHGLRPDDCIFMDTEHGDRITYVDASHAGTTITTETLITKDPGVALILLTGDCLPISFHDPVQGVIALAHLGWKPTDLKLVQKVVREMSATYGTRPEDLRVFIGPGIHKESYIVPEVRQLNPEEWGGFLTPLPNGETRVDLIGYNQAQLLASGITPEHIEISPIDTATDPTYFSHYRSVRTGEPEGRFATILGIKG